MDSQRTQDYLPNSAGLKEGDEGEDVARLQKYLSRYGYFNTDILDVFGARGKYSLIIPQREGLFDERTREALENFQEAQGLTVTGELDEETYRLINLPRCGNRDEFRFETAGTVWGRYNLTYGFQEFSAHLNPADIRVAIRQAFNLWEAVTLLRFTEIPLDGNPDIVIRFVRGDHGDGKPFDDAGTIGSNTFAHAFYPPPNSGALAGDAHFDDYEAWSINLTTGIDLVTVAAHEFGHSLGLSHSRDSSAVMYAYYQGPHRYLAPDDVAGIQVLYRPLVQRPGRANDISIGANGAVFHVGTTPQGNPFFSPGFEIARWNGSNWDRVQGIAGIQVAVAPDGSPWHVTRNGDMYRWTGSAWQQLPGRATHLAVGANGAIFHVGTTPQPGGLVSPGYELAKWTGSGWERVPGAARQVAVAPDGTPWIVNNFGQIFRWTNNNWQHLPGNATHLAIGADGTVCHVGTTEMGQGGFEIARWNGYSWVRYPRAAALKVAADPNGLPWHMNRQGDIYQLV